MTRRTKSEWYELIEQQKTSGLSAAEFCRRNSVNPKYFSLRKKQLADSRGDFVRVTAPPTRKPHAATNGIKVRILELDIPGEAVGETLGILMERLAR
jgi:hypothetical protein